MNLNQIKSIIPTLSFQLPCSAQEYLDNLYVENFHSHTDFSNVSIADSPVEIESYAKRCKEFGTKCLYSGEHGNQGNQFKVYECAEKYGLKYIHSAEAYWVKDRHEKDNKNCHINIIATCAEGREDLNYILSIANEDGYYYKPRLDLDLILSVPKSHFIITSACVAGWKYDDADEIWLKIAEHFEDNFFLEVQNHNTDAQKKLNKHILELAKKHNLQIICGLDSHYIEEATDDIKRNQILKYKKIFYDDEQGWYLDYPDSKTIYQRFIKQDVLTETQILESMMNTNVFVSKCQTIVFDRSFKIPCVYPNTTYDERVKIFKDILNKQYRKEKLKSEEKKNGIRYEVEQIVDSHVVDYFLTNQKIVKTAIDDYGGILTTTSRGSASSFIVNKLLGFTTLDRFSSEIPIYPERFLTKERVLAGQMPDIDFNIATQEPFVKASRQIIGEHGCYPLMAIEVLKEKAAWQLYAGASDVPPDDANNISKFIDKYNDALKYADEEDKPFIKVEDFIPSDYLELYKQSRDYQGIVINLKVHACGHIILDGDVRRKIGLISAISETTGKRTLCACIEGGYLDSFGYVKNDFLIVDSVSLVKECFDSINEPVPSFDELREMVKNDNLTWGIYEKGITCCVNQLEKSSTTKRAMIYKPQNLAELAAFIAGIRPGFASLLSTFINRQEYTTGEDKIDELLADSYHFALYQESLMKVLSFLGQPMTETYGVIKSISKKKLKGEKKENLEKSLTQNWKDIFGNINNFNNVWNVIEDSARYAFNAPHALSMAGDSAYLAWFKSHYTSKFYEVAICHYQHKDNKKKIDALIKEANEFYGYRIAEYRFGDDNRSVHVDDDNKLIYPTMDSIKNMQKIASDELYKIRDKHFDNCLDLFVYLLEQTQINSRSIEILIKIGYFNDYKSIEYQWNVYQYFCNRYKKTYVDKTKEARLQEIRDYAQTLNVETTIFDKIHYQIQLLGYTNLTTPCDDDIYAIQALESNQWGTPFVTLYQVNSGVTAQYKADKRYYNDHPLEVGDIIDAAIREKDKKRKSDNGWETVGSEEVLVAWSKEI